MSTKSIETWAIVELLGHVRLAGKLTEEEHFGTKLGRLEIPQASGEFITVFFGGSSIYRISPVSEEAARVVAAHSQHQPINSWDLPRLPSPTATMSTFVPDEDEDEDDDEEDDGGEDEEPPFCHG